MRNNCFGIAALFGLGINRFGRISRRDDRFAIRLQSNPLACMFFGHCCPIEGRHVAIIAYFGERGGADTEKLETDSELFFK